MRARIVAVDPAAEDGDRLARRLERAAVRPAVDAAGEPGDDDDAGRGELAARASARRARRSRCSSGRRRSRRSARRAARGAAEPRRKSPGGGSWIDRRRGGKRRSLRDSQRSPLRSELGEVGGRVERGSEAREPPRPRLALGRVLVARRGEHGQGELAHARAQLRRRAVRERLGEVLRRDPLGAGERRDRPRDARDARAAATRQREPLDRAGEQVLRLGVAGSGVGAEPADEPRRLAPGRRLRSLAGRRRELGRARSRQRDDEVEAVEQRPRQLVAVAGRVCSGEHVHSTAGSPRPPHGQRFIVPTSWNRAGKRARPPTRAIAIVPSSSGCRSASSTARGNSGSSSSSSTP